MVYSEEHNWEGTIASLQDIWCGYKDLRDIDLSVYEIALTREVDGPIGGLSWDILESRSPAFSQFICEADLYRSLRMPEDYMELKKMHPPINE